MPEHAFDFDFHRAIVHRAILRAREKCDDVLSLRRNQRREEGEAK